MLTALLCHLYFNSGSKIKVKSVLAIKVESNGFKMRVEIFLRTALLCHLYFNSGSKIKFKSMLAIKVESNGFKMRV